VLEATSGSDGVLMAQNHTGPIALLLTDVVMPRMSGGVLAERIAALRPEVRVLFMSGYTDEAIVRHGVLEAGMHFIEKPFTPTTLAVKVRAVLKARAEDKDWGRRTRIRVPLQADYHRLFQRLRSAARYTSQSGGNHETCEFVAKSG
jgi:FixJ family two-component response regulator